MRSKRLKLLCFKDKVEILLSILASISIVILFLIIIFVLKEGFPAFIRLGFSSFLLGRRWAPYYEDFGAFPLLYGSILIVFGSLAISVPLGVSTAIFLAEYSPKWLSDMIKPVIELLASIPSIIYGFFGLTFLAPKIMEFLNISMGKVALTASMVLSIMTLPTIVSISSEVIASVPKE